MRPHAALAAASAAAIAAALAHGGLGAYGIGTMEYWWDGPGDFGLFALSNHGRLGLCTAVPAWTDLRAFEIETYHDGRHLGTFALQPLVIGPFGSAVQEGMFSSEGVASSQYVFMTLDFEASGGEVGLDPAGFEAVVRAETAIIGVIPYSSESRMDAASLYGSMRDGGC